MEKLMANPKVVLDLFCGGGGAADGYVRAGYEVLGVDINPQPYYPYEFFKGDAIEYLERKGSRYDIIHASPPCQGYSYATGRNTTSRNNLGRDEPKLVGVIRKKLHRLGKPYVIENLVGAINEMGNPFMLCATMFDLPISRHRLFDVYPRIKKSWIPEHVDCVGVAREYAEERGWDILDMRVAGNGRRAGITEIWKEIMGIDREMRQLDLKEAIPPAYTEWIGEHLKEIT
jgi:site-specific DNA-cytosine methylase